MSAINLGAKPELAARTRLQKDQITGEPVLLYPEGVLVLNETARDIVRRCTGDATVGEIVAALASEYEADVEELTLDVIECLHSLSERNFIVLKA